MRRLGRKARAQREQENGGQRRRAEARPARAAAGRRQPQAAERCRRQPPERSGASSRRPRSRSRCARAGRPALSPRAASVALRASTTDCWRRRGHRLSRGRFPRAQFSAGASSPRRPFGRPFPSLRTRCPAARPRFPISGGGGGGGGGTDHGLWSHLELTPFIGVDPYRTRTGKPRQPRQHRARGDLHQSTRHRELYRNPPTAATRPQRSHRRRDPALTGGRSRTRAPTPPAGQQTTRTIPRTPRRRSSLDNIPTRATARKAPDTLPFGPHPNTTSSMGKSCSRYCVC